MIREAWDAVCALALWVGVCSLGLVALALVGFACSEVRYRWRAWRTPVCRWGCGTVLTPETRDCTHPAVCRDCANAWYRRWRSLPREVMG